MLIRTCDVCGKALTKEDYDNEFNVIVFARRNALAGDWIHNSDVRDLCKACSEKIEKELKGNV